MPKTPQQTPDKVDLDQLLQLKRSERPTEIVWERFDRELHQRMLQTLMKKDPWYVQLFHGLSGRVAQGSVLAAVVVVALLVARTAFIASPSTSVNFAENSIQTEPLAAVEFAKATTADLLDSEIVATPDYGIETFSAGDVPDGIGYERDFGMDRIETANYDVLSYSADSARSRTAFANTSIASIAF